MNSLKIFGLAVALAAGTGAAQAGTVYASSVDVYNQGTGITDATRTVTANALGAADGKFLTLGLGGDAVLSFGTKFKPTGSVVEITFGTRASTPESVDLYGGLNGVFTFLGSITNVLTSTSFSFAGVFDQLQLVDTSPAGKKRDGFDIDAISVAAVPVPAGGLLLVSALGAVAALRRRKA